VAALNPHGAPTEQQDIVRFQVTVHDASGVGLGQGACDLLRDLRCSPPRQVTVPPDLSADGLKQ
jgi:hypothetical protein